MDETENLNNNTIMPKTKKTQPAPAEITADEIKEAARILKTKGTKKRERRKAAGVMGLVGGSIGGHNRARNLTPEQRREIARLGGIARQAKAREEREKLHGKTPLTTQQKALKQSSGE